MRPNWAPEDVDLDRPSVARVYDYYLGGSHNFAADRSFAERVIGHMPGVIRIARENRAFLRRAVQYLCRAGIRQFIDLGSGIPTVGNVHEVAQEADPACRVVYVDRDPVAIAHSQAILAGSDTVRVVAADLRRPAEVLEDPAVREFIDFSRPVGLMFVAVLHFLPDSEEPARIVAEYAAATAPGSHVVVSHAGIDRRLTGGEEEAVTAYRRSPTPLVLRSPSEIEALFGGLTLVEPGVVRLARWRPEPDQAEAAGDEREASGFCGMGRKD